VDANYTNEQLTFILNKIDDQLYKYSNKVFNKYVFGINCVDLCPYYKLYLYKRIITDWNQNQNGYDENIYNSITLEQFNNVIAAALNYCK
jgi:hypothetical protein